MMERMHDIRISRTEELRVVGADVCRFVRDGVEILFTQVPRDDFFHADIYPDNILISVVLETLGRYIALSFGVVGTLSGFDKSYLAQNFLAFFQRNYRCVTVLRIGSDWAPEETHIEELEGTIHACCKPYFDRPLGKISLGLVLMRLFRTSRYSDMEVQPQLVLLQKTLLNVEGLGRQFGPSLDLWKTVRPFLERWMHEQIGWRDFVERLKVKVPQWTNKLPNFPRLVHQILDCHSREDNNAQTTTLTVLLAEQKRTNQLLSVTLPLAGDFTAGIVATHVLTWMARY